MYIFFSWVCQFGTRCEKSDICIPIPHLTLCSSMHMVKCLFTFFTFLLLKKIIANQIPVVVFVRAGHSLLFPPFAIRSSATSTPLFAIATLLLFRKLQYTTRYTLFAIATFVSSALRTASILGLYLR
jgi:hypothetical protein